jgi:DNA-binding MarR family transcriptional regulator
MGRAPNWIKEWEPVTIPRAPLALGDDEVLVDEGLAGLMRAARVRRVMDAALRAHDLSFSLWCVLYTTDRLVREESGAVSQLAVARRMELDKGNVSHSMTVLERRGWVDRGPDCYLACYRILVTDKGKRVLGLTRGVVARLMGELEI